MEYIYTRYSDIPELVVPIKISLIEGYTTKEATVPSGYVEVITSNVLWSPPCLSLLLRSICVTNDNNCSVCHNHTPVLSSFIAYHRICNKSNTTGDTC